MSRKVWEGLLPLLEPYFSVHLLDLPGHGGTPLMSDCQSLSDWADVVAEQVPGNALWLAWSLGALVALDLAARRPEKVSGLVVVGGTPKFVQADGWACAMPKAVFDPFVVSLDQDVDGTMQRFLALQAKGSATPRATLKQLKSVYQQMPPSTCALKLGLEFLGEADLRKQLSGIVCPLLFLNAQNDRLIPASLLAALQQQYSMVQTVLMNDCGHVLFLNRPEVFAQVVIDFFFGESYR